jgi:hypothetical protein
MIFGRTEAEMICDIGPILQDVEFIIINFPYFDEASGINVYRGDELLLSHGIVNLEASEFDIWDYKYYMIGLVVLIIVILYFILRRKDSPLPVVSNIPLARRYG